MENPTLSKNPASFLRLPEVIKRTGLAKSTIYDLIKNGSFPPPIQLGARCSSWIEREIDEWIASKIVEGREVKSIEKMKQRGLLRPVTYKSGSEFELTLSAQGIQSEKSKEIVAHFKAQETANMFVRGAIWADRNYSVFYHQSLSWCQLYPGQLEAAYHASANGNHLFPIERSPRSTFSDDRNART
ncbi:helix-turn-helix transcriptional regulator [Aurantivibrio plasticivorans]